MNILGNNSSKLNDVIFENRNKNYGAYDIRQSYNDSLLKSLFYLSGVIALVFGSAFIYNKLNKLPITEKLIILNDPILNPVEYVTKVDITPITEPIHNIESAAAPAGALGTVINENAVETNSVNTDNLISGVGSQSATGVSLHGTETSTVISSPEVAINTIASTDAVIVADEMPEFEGGVAGLMRYVSQNIVYPSIAKEIGIQGVVYVSFVVNESGNVESAKVMRGIGHGCDEEVMRVINKMPRWKKVGKNAGHPVKVRFNIPVSYKLQ